MLFPRPSTQQSTSLATETEEKKLFRLSDGRIIYHGTYRHHLDVNSDWYGCSFCKRWFESMPLLEEHYAWKHEEADSYQFELLELKNCVITLPFVLPSFFDAKTTPTPGTVESVPLATTALATDEDENQVQEPGDDDINQRLSALKLSTGDPLQIQSANLQEDEAVVEVQEKVEKLSMKKAIRRAIKATQTDKNGSSYKRIKAYLVNKTGMNAEKLNKKLRKILERFVEFSKLGRRFRKGKTLYSIRPSKEQRKKKGGKIPLEETRKFRDQQLRLIVKSLRPHV